ncbi:hypothetical protein ABI_41720 [Asticcacaulis biprosthecium C19]|uniref:DUF1476 family protein n=1 Tax=Asticcacaulis biprosthecium C19 TaxID=715226 RepID=F4QSM9_9CAUL|nr:ATPase inhibitor subunit zeta [Asticcacaulis biprosthecium]EGF89749.1 hypothetical protein ABI_41720 [Asticcacaulis biprosthecium C19]
MSHSEPIPEAASVGDAAERKAASGRNRAIALWAAARMDLNPQSTELYAQAVENFHADRPTEEDVIRKIYGDLIASNIQVRESEVRTRAAEFLAQAREAGKNGN